MNRALFSILGIIVFSFHANMAFAYNIYNKAGAANPYSIEVWGEHCPACFHGHVKRGEHKSCPGNEDGCKGHTQITACILIMGGDVYGNTNELRACSKKVPAHGWVEFVDAHIDPYNRGPQDSMRCFVYDEHGKVLNDGPMEQVSGYNTCNARR